MRKSCILTFLLLLLIGILFISFNSTIDETFLVQNMTNRAALPKNFRSTLISAEKEQLALYRNFADLRISGSGQFSQKSFELMLEELHHPDYLVVIDLREESHGFLNGDAVSWYAQKNWGNQGKYIEQINKEERKLLQGLRNKKDVEVHAIISKNQELGSLAKTKQFTMRVQNVSSEEELVKQAGAHYIRFPLTDHVRPDDARVDQFVYLVRHLPKSAWIHVHCSAGAGRASTTMIMVDCLKNAKELTFEEILQRQQEIGGADLNKPVAEKAWKKRFYQERVRFLESFYQYCRNNQDNYNTPWSYYTRGVA